MRTHDSENKVESARCRAERARLRRASRRFCNARGARVWEAAQESRFARLEQLYGCVAQTDAR